MLEGMMAQLLFEGEWEFEGEENSGFAGSGDRALFNYDSLVSWEILKDIKALWLKELGDFIKHVTSTSY